MIKTQTLEMRGIYRRDFIKYFLKIGNKSIEDKVFKGDYWEVSLSEQTWINVGSLKIQRTFITFNVEEKYFDEFLATFRINFLRCGG